MYKAVRMRTVAVRERRRWGRDGGARAADGACATVVLRTSCFCLLLGFSAAAPGREAGGRPTMSLTQNLREIMKAVASVPGFDRVLQKV